MQLKVGGYDGLLCLTCTHDTHVLQSFIKFLFKWTAWSTLLYLASSSTVLFVKDPVSLCLNRQAGNSYCWPPKYSLLCAGPLEMALKRSDCGLTLGTAGEEEKEYWKKLREGQGKRRENGGRGFNDRGRGR